MGGKGQNRCVNGLSHQVLRASAVLYAGAGCLGSYAAIRDDIAGEPLGIRLQLSVPEGIAAGWGAGVAAPWPMPVAAVLAAWLPADRRRGARPALVCAALGIGCLVGTLVEPVTYRSRTWSRTTRAALIANVVSSGALAAAGGWRAQVLRNESRAERRREST